MKQSDTAWSYWSKESLSPVNPSYHCGWAFGTPDEPASSIWCASLLEPLRKTGYLNSEFSALDFGCGDGRLFNFLSRRYKKFQYFGIEQDNTFGWSCLRSASASFGKDSRACFAAVGSPKAAEAIDKATFVVLGSVATHLKEKELLKCLAPYQGALRRGAPLVASFFVGKAFSAFSPGIYDNPECYTAVTYTSPMVNDIARALGCGATQEEEFVAKDGHLHRIFLFRKV